MNPLILIPAAGASSRMRGQDKLMVPVDGVPLLVRQAMRAVQTGWPVLVTCSMAHLARQQALRPLPVSCEAVDGSEGMSVSLRAGGLAAQKAGRPLLVMLPDMPDLDTDDILDFAAMAQNAPDQVHRAASQDGIAGHPVWIPRALLPMLAELTGDQGAKPLFAGAKPRLHRLPGNRAITDLDTPEAWATWRAQRQPAR